MIGSQLTELPGLMAGIMRSVGGGLISDLRLYPTIPSDRLKLFFLRLELVFPELCFETSEDRTPPLSLELSRLANVVRCPRFFIFELYRSSDRVFRFLKVEEGRFGCVIFKLE